MKSLSIGNWDRPSGIEIALKNLHLLSLVASVMERRNPAETVAAAAADAAS